MAGDESSTDIMAGVNQVVTAINDIIVASTCTPQVSVSCDGTGGGTEVPSDGGTQGDTPPTGWSEPPDAVGTPEYDTRKCKMANAIHESLVDWLTLWQTYEVDGFASSFLTIALISLLGALVGEIATPVPLIDGIIGLIIGYLSGVAIVIITTTFNLATILSLMSTYEQELVCELYNATTTQGGIDDYIQILDDNGASAGDILLLRAVIAIDLLNNLFFKRGDAVDDALADYTAPLSCAGCTTCSNWVILNGTLISGSLAGDTTGFVVQSVYLTQAGCNRHQVYIVPPTNCTKEITHFCTGQVDKTCAPGWCFGFLEGPSSTPVYSITYTAGTDCLEETGGWFWMRSQPGNQFTLDVTVDGPC